MRKCGAPLPRFVFFPLITDLLAIEVYQAHKSKQDRGPDRERALYTGRTLILSGLESKLQFRQLVSCKPPLFAMSTLIPVIWNNASVWIITVNSDQTVKSWHWQGYLDTGPLFVYLASDTLLSKITFNQELFNNVQWTKKDLHSALLKRV